MKSNITLNLELMSALRSSKDKLQTPNTFSQACEKVSEILSQDECKRKKIINTVYDFLLAVVEQYCQKEEFKAQSEVYDKLLETASKSAAKFAPNQQLHIAQWKEKDFSVVQKRLEQKAEKKKLENKENSVPRRLRFAEAVLSRRTDRFLLVLEKVYDDFNQQAVLRTAESFGVQNVWTIISPNTKNHCIAKKITKGNHAFLSLRHFKTTNSCIEALREQGRTIWATDLTSSSLSLESAELKIPEKLAIVIGSEAFGVSPEMLQASDMRVFLPIHGFTDSLNLTVAAALILQRLFLLCPEARGNLSEENKRILRQIWYGKLAKTEKHKEDFKKYLENPPKPLDDLRKSLDEKNPAYIPPKLKNRVKAKEEMIKNLEKESKSENV